jgi:RHS repeat-associated protein
LDPHKIPIDPNGNLTTKTEGTDNWTYTWNAENQLTKVEKNSVEQARFSYDPSGRRAEKVAGGVTTTYTYDSYNILAEVRGSTTLKYVAGGIDKPLAVDDGAALSFFHADGLGSIVKLTNAAGAATLTRHYDAWGSLQAGADQPGYAFTGREWDPETGLYYYRARYYDPRIGRFISEDPIGLGSGDGANFFPYVANNPTTRIDPLGLASCREDCLKEAQEIYRQCRAAAQDAYDKEVDRINKMCSGLPRLLIPACWQWKPGNYWEVAKGEYYAELSRCRKERLANEATCKKLPPCGSRGGC